MNKEQIIRDEIREIEEEISWEHRAIYRLDLWKLLKEKEVELYELLLLNEGKNGGGKNGRERIK